MNITQCVKWVVHFMNVNSPFLFVKVQLLQRFGTFNPDRGCSPVVFWIIIIFLKQALKMVKS